MIEPFPLIEISGLPHERGRQYGQQAADRIRNGVAHYTSQLHQLSLDAAAIVELVRDYRPIIEQFEPAFIEEMLGIAEGAGISFEEAVAQAARKRPAFMAK